MVAPSGGRTLIRLHTKIKGYGSGKSVCPAVKTCNSKRTHITNTKLLIVLEQVLEQTRLLVASTATSRNVMAGEQYSLGVYKQPRHFTILQILLP